jgi:hypothetical protein
MIFFTNSIKGQRLTLGGCKAPSRGEGRAQTGPLCVPVQGFYLSSLEHSND